jgi:hypothetical protein
MSKLNYPDELRAFYRQAAARRVRSDRPCAQCGTVMYQVIGKRRYCSTACHHKAAYERAKARREVVPEQLRSE